MSPQIGFLPEHIGKIWRWNTDETIAITTFNDNNFFTVPDDKIWLVAAIVSSTDVLDADQAVTVQGYMNLSGLNGCAFGDPVRVAVNEQGGFGMVFGANNPLVLPEKSQIGIYTTNEDGGAAGTINMNLYVLHREINNA